MGGTNSDVSWEDAPIKRPAQRRGPTTGRASGTFLRAILLCGLVGFASPAAHADAFYKGLVAYNTRDYGTAAQIWRRLADQGHAKAQSSLGFLYIKGLGVPANSALAA